MINLFVNTAYAADPTIATFIGNVKTAIINPIIGILFAAALLMFVWGVVRYMMNADDDNERKMGQQHMIWGLFGMFIMVSVFGIVDLIASVLK